MGTARIRIDDVDGTVFEESGSPQTLCKRLLALQSQAQGERNRVNWRFEKRLRFCGEAFQFLIYTAPIALPVLIMVWAAASGPWWMLGLLLVPPGVVGLCAGALWIRREQLRPEWSIVAGRRVALIRPILTMLEADAGESPFHLWLDRRDVDRRANLFDRSGKRSRSGYWRVKHYRVQGLELRARLADGTRLRLATVETFQVLKRFSILKPKTKLKSVLQLVLQLRPKPARYPGLERLAPAAEGAVKILRVPNAKLRQVVVRQDALVIKATLKQDGRWDPRRGAELAAQCLLSLYHILTLARRLPAGQQPPAAPSP